MTAAGRAAKLVVLLVHAGSCLPHAPSPAAHPHPTTAESAIASETADAAAAAAAEVPQAASPQRGTDAALHSQHSSAEECEPDNARAASAQSDQGSHVLEAQRRSDGSGSAEDEQPSTAADSQARQESAQQRNTPAEQSGTDNDQQPHATFEAGDQQVSPGDEETQLNPDVSGQHLEAADDDEDEWEEGFTAAESPTAAGAADSAGQAGAADGVAAVARSACLQVWAHQPWPLQWTECLLLFVSMAEDHSR